MINTTSLSDQVEHAIKKEILSGTLAPGQRLSLDEIADRLGVSNMPVRDAVRRLETTGFLVVSSRRGVFVSKFDRKRFINIFNIRTALECLAVELSVHRIPEEDIERGISLYQEGGRQLKELGDSSLLSNQDPYVHHLILKYCNNPELMEIINDLRDLIDWGHQIVAIYQPDSLEFALPEHIAVLEALKARKGELAVNAMRMHLKGTLNRTLRKWSEEEINP